MKENKICSLQFIYSWSDYLSPPYDEGLSQNIKSFFDELIEYKENRNNPDYWSIYGWDGTYSVLLAALKKLSHKDEKRINYLTVNETGMKFKKSKLIKELMREKQEKQEKQETTNYDFVDASYSEQESKEDFDIGYIERKTGKSNSSGHNVSKKYNHNFKRYIASGNGNGICSLQFVDRWYFSPPYDEGLSQNIKSFFDKLIDYKENRNNPDYWSSLGWGGTYYDLWDALKELSHEDEKRINYLTVNEAGMKFKKSKLIKELMREKQEKQEKTNYDFVDDSYSKQESKEDFDIGYIERKTAKSNSSGRIVSKEYNSKSNSSGRIVSEEYNSNSNSNSNGRIVSEEYNSNSNSNSNYNSNIIVPSEYPSVINYIEFKYNISILKSYYECLSKIYNESSNVKQYIDKSNVLIDVVVGNLPLFDKEEVAQTIKEHFCLTFSSDKQLSEIVNELVGDELRYYQQMYYIKEGKKVDKNKFGNSKIIRKGVEKEQGNLPISFSVINDKQESSYKFNMNLFYENNFSIYYYDGKNLSTNSINHKMMSKLFEGDVSELEIIDDYDGKVNIFRNNRDVNKKR